MSIKKSYTYKKFREKYIDYKLNSRIRMHERDINHLKSKIEVHEEVLKVLNKRKVKV